ncbi:hypothetical protein C0J52_27232 [Blattella germanica]|nr:hypothetical protein C0J52_27232 [Blattella germanica]
MQAVLDEAKKCQDKMDAAQALIGGLAGERVRWTEQSAMFKAEIERLVGDVLLLTGFLSYAGPFNQEFRRNLQKYWIDELIRRKIPLSSNLSIIDSLTDTATIGEWNLQGLPSDELSIENGIIVTKAARFPLLIDPQSQGKQWIRNKEKDNELEITTLDDKYFRNRVEDTVSNGRPMLIEDVGEELDPILDNVLEKNFIKIGTGLKVKVGDKEVDVDMNFRIYITTKLPNPSYTPEVAARTSMIDFTVTMKGLEDQLLGRVILSEKRELESERTNLITEVTSNKRKMKELEQNLLYKLTTVEGSLVDDETVIQVLNTTKDTAADVKQKLAVASETEKKINTAREEFRPVASRGSVLYFLIVEMSFVNCMYQTSLVQFLERFDVSLARSDKSPVTHKRIHFIIEYLTFEIFKYKCRVPQSERQWKTWFDKEAPEEEVMPDGYQTSLDVFRRLLMVRSWCPDRTLSQARKYVGSSLGERFNDPVITNYEEMHEESRPFTPMLCLLSLGSDPTNQILALGKKLEFQVRAISMGQGQEVHARKLLTQCMTENTHLGLDYMFELFIALTETETSHPDFRTWITTEVHVNYPISLLQICIKYTNEPPQGMRAGLKRTYASMSQDHLEYTDVPMYIPVVYAISFLHTVVQERRKFGPLGWNIPYEFNSADWYASNLFLQNHLDDLDPKKGISWNTVRFQSNTTKQILDTILSVQPKESSIGGGETRETIVARMTNDMLKKLPKDYDPFEALRDALDNIYDARVPNSWKRGSWESSTLGFWFTELLERNAQFATWCFQGRPPMFWMTGFFNPQGFLTAMRQEVARAHKWSLDSVVLHNEVTKSLKEDVKTSPPVAQVRSYVCFKSIVVINQLYYSAHNHSIAHYLKFMLRCSGLSHSSFSLLPW